MKTSIAIGGRLAMMCGHALCLFLCSPLFEPKWEPLEETSVRELRKTSFSLIFRSFSLFWPPLFFWNFSRTYPITPRCSHLLHGFYRLQICVYIYSLHPSLHRHPCRNETRSLLAKTRKEYINIDFPEAVKKAPRPNIFKGEGGAFSSGNSILTQRERGKQKKQKPQKKQRFGRSAKSVGRWSGRRAPGREKSGGKRKMQRGSRLSSKQDKAKGKAQESRHQNRFPPLF